MRRLALTPRVLAAIVVLAVELVATAAVAATVHDFEAAYAAAVAQDKGAAGNKNQWPATKDALAAARKAADAHDYDKAVALAEGANALAQASINQSRSEAAAWKDATIP